jgi:hypothetical protein
VIHLGGRVSHLQVFSWKDFHHRYPLARKRWWKHLSVTLADHLSPDYPGWYHYAFIEFVKDDAPEQLLDDAAALRSWLL